MDFVCYRFRFYRGKSTARRAPARARRARAAPGHPAAAAWARGGRGVHAPDARSPRTSDDVTAPQRTMAFWGLEVKPGKQPAVLNLERRLVVKQAALVVAKPDPTPCVLSVRRLSPVRTARG